MRYLRKLAAIIAVITAATTAAVMAAPPVVQAQTRSVYATEAANVRIAPNLSGEAIMRLVPGSALTIRCAIAGQQIYDTNVWFYGDVAPGVVGFYTAYYTDAVYDTWDDLLAGYGIPRCDAPSPALGGSVYYQPRYSEGDPLAPFTTFTATKDTWAPPPDSWNPWAAPTCLPEHSNAWPAFFDRKLVTRASGWSLGRLGITYLLSAYPGRADQLDEIVLFDPGSLADYEGPCDGRYEQDVLLADWLAKDSTRRVLIIAGEVTRDRESRVRVKGKVHYHQGIQQRLFGAVRDRAVDDQVLVCNFDRAGHAEIMERFGYLAASGSMTSCPPGADAAWSP